MSLLMPWTQEERESYGHTVQTFKHNLKDTGLFDNTALADLLDRHPRHLIDVCTMTDDPDYPNKHCTVDFRGFSGAQLIEAAERGHVWINVREAMNKDPAYNGVMERLFGELKTQTRRHRLWHRCRGGILISSPVAKVPYHCDPTMTLLWHIRGRKRVFVYPPSSEFLPDTAYEAVVLGEKDQDIPYKSGFEKAAKVFDLSEDTLVCWPHTSPHRVENQSFCVSMVMEFSSPSSSFRNSVIFTNGLLRRHLGIDSSWHESGRLERFVKSVCGHVLRRLGAHKPFIRRDPVRFALDSSSDSFLRAIPMVERNF